MLLQFSENERLHSILLDKVQIITNQKKEMQDLQLNIKNLQNKNDHVKLLEQSLAEQTTEKESLTTELQNLMCDINQQKAFNTQLEQQYTNQRDKWNSDIEELNQQLWEKEKNMMEFKLKLSEQDLTIQSLTSDIERLKNIEQDLLSSEEAGMHLNTSINEKDKRIEQLRSNIIQLEILLSDARNWESQYIKTHELLITTEGDQQFTQQKLSETEKEKEMLLQKAIELQQTIYHESEQRAKAVEEISSLQERINQLQKELIINNNNNIQNEIPDIELSEKIVQTSKNNDFEEMKQLLTTEIKNKLNFQLIIGYLRDQLIKEQEQIIDKLNSSIEDILQQCKENIEKNSELQLKIEQYQLNQDQFDVLISEKDNDIEQIQKSLELAEKMASEKQNQIYSLSQLIKQKIEFSNEQEYKIKDMTNNMQQMAYQIGELEKVLNENQEIFEKNTQLEENIRIVYEQLERSQKLNTEQQEIILDKIEKEKVSNKEILKLSSLMKNEFQKSNEKNQSNKYEFETPNKDSCCQEYERQIIMLTNQIEPLLNEIELWKQKYKEFENTCTEALNQSQASFQLQQALENKEKQLTELEKQTQKERSQMFLLFVEVDSLRRRLNFQQVEQEND